MSFRSDDAADAGDSPPAGIDLDALELEELASPPADAMPRRRPLRRNDSGGDAQTSRLLEALEALSSETGGAMPPSLRSLLGQLQGDENAMAGLFPFMQLLDSHGSHPRFQRMLQSINADAPAHVQLSGLSDLCESLSMSSEESLVVSGFSVDKFLPPVMQLVRAPSTMEVLLLAARALSSMFELFPTVAVPKAMAAGPTLVDSICAKLLEIEYMDVAELAFQILERIVFSPQSETLSAEYRRTVIAANGFVALLQFVDFFPIEIQRTAARVVSGLCTNVGTDSMGELQLALPLIAGLLRSSDAEIVQHGCKSFQAMATSPAFIVHEEFAQLVANEDTCSSLAQLLESFANRGEEQSSSKVPIPACASILQFMSAVLSSPHEAMKGEVNQLRFVRLPSTVATLLGMQTIVDDVSLLRETLKLVGVILPSAQGIEHQDQSENYQNTMRPFVRAILPCVIQVYEVSGRKDVRHDCLGVILRVCLMQQKVDQADRDSADLIHLSSFLARVLRPEGIIEQSEKAETRISCVALQIVQACLHSDSSISSHPKSLFERHGVNAAIRRISRTEGASESSEDGGVGALAKLLVDEYIGDQDESAEPSMDNLRKTVCDLEASLAQTDEGHPNRAEAISTVLRQLLEICRERQELAHSGEGWLTAHEIASSGLSKVLTRLLQDAGGRRAFSEIFLGQSDESAASVFIGGLVSSIQDAISAEKDAFRVDGVLAESSMPLSTGSVTNDMDQLTQHIKVKVKIEDNESASANPDVKRNKRSVHDTVVLVEPLARIDTIEEFIADKLFGSRSPFGAIDGDEDELLGPRHRRRARSQESDVEEKSDHDEDDAIDDHDEEDQDDEQEDENDDLRSDRPQKQMRLQVLYSGVVMRGESSVLEAILKQPPTEGSENSSGDLSKVWSGAPHEFLFRVLSKETRKDSKDACALSKADESTLTHEDAPSTSKWWDDVWDLLLILRHLHQLLGNSKSVQFVNGYISLQVHRALSQPVRVMTNSLPQWSYRIVEEYPFVLSYDTRFDFMYATTSGAPRAISYLCRTLWKKAAFAEEPTQAPPSGRENSRSSRRLARDRNGASSRSATNALANLSRMAKLPRLKVRVARSRLLQSAMKLFTMYGGKKAIIEIEFLGEVGTGLGPTTEFYTLVCHELQASHLKLWRNDKDVPTDEAESDENASPDVSAKKKSQDSDKAKKPGLPVRGYHRIAVYHCPSCKHLDIPRCSIHDLLLTHEKSGSDDIDQPSPDSIPQCAKCLDSRDWHSAYTSCKSCEGCKVNEEAASGTLAAAAASTDDDIQEGVEAKSADKKKQCALRWWILSEEEVLYLHKVYPKDVETIKHPVLQCTHCDTVNFPGTDAGIVVLDHTGERMVSRAGRRMYERDYRAVTKHVSPLCEGTPLKQIGVVLTRDVVETLVDCAKKSPELLDSEVESLSYMSEVAVQGEIEVVDAPHGLFPKPYKEAKTSVKDKLLVPDTLTWFNFMGRFVAQAILDERLLNLPLSRAFLRALRGEALVGSDVDLAQSIGFVREVDPAIAQSLSYLLTLADEAAAETDPSVVETKASLVESMGLAFTLVGDGSIELRDGGKNESVSLENLREYVRLNVSFLLHETIHRQVGAFYEGFETISGCADTRQFLRSFALHELEFLFADKGLEGDSMWGRDGKELREHMVCDHGYSPQSRAIHDLVAILCELSLEEQRLFVKFVTGANRLPLGGLAKLEPKLTVVRKLASGDDGEATDAVLPSASTCTNYLKLPEYSTREAMRSRLLYCIHEGQGSFHLS